MVFSSLAVSATIGGGSVVRRLSRLQILAGRNGLTIRRGLGLPFHFSRVHFDGHETESMCEHFLLDDGRVVVHVDIFDRYGRYLCDMETFNEAYREFGT